MSKTKTTTKGSKKVVSTKRSSKEAVKKSKKSKQEAALRATALKRLATLKKWLDGERLLEHPSIPDACTTGDEELDEFYRQAAAPPEGPLEVPQRYLACFSEGTEDVSYRDNPLFDTADNLASMNNYVEWQAEDGWGCNWIVDLDKDEWIEPQLGDEFRSR